MFDWLSKLLHWRQGNEVIVHGEQTQFIPVDGVYVVARQYKGKAVMTILNGTDHDAICQVKRYAEIIGGRLKATDIISGDTVRLDQNIRLSPRQTLIIEIK